MELHIDTVEYGKAVFSLKDGEKKIAKSFLVKPQESDKVLEFLDNFLKLSKIKNPTRLSGVSSRRMTGAKSPHADEADKISSIVIHKGEGSFTGLRVGVAIADALSLAWQVPVKVLSAN
jgi:tRNA A37 threonylcarbamoyladenosine modification protein TsaB